MTPNRIVASLLLALSATCAVAGTSPTDIDELHQRQFRYARAMMQLNQLEGFERGPSVDTLLKHERDAKAKRVEQRWRDPADARAQSMDAFASAVEQSAAAQRAKRTMSRQWQIDESVPAYWSVSGNEAAAADCARAIEHPLGQPLRIEMSRDGVAWLRVVAPSKGFWAFDTLVSEFDTKLSVYRDCRHIANEAKQISDDVVGLGSIVGLNADAVGQTFLIKLERKGGVGSLAIAKSVLAQSISGTVRRAFDNALVPYGHVELIRSDGSRAYSSDDVDANGEYSIPVYETGDYYLRAMETNAYYGGPSGISVPEVYPNAICASLSDASLEFCEGTKSVVSVAEEQAVSGIDFMLDRTSILSGVVTDDRTGEPVVGAYVSLFASDDTNENATQRSTSTDSLGRFRFLSLPARSWRAEFSHSRHVLERWDGVQCGGECVRGSGNTFSTTTASATVLAPDLTPRSYLQFRVSAGSIPAQSASITLFNQNGALVASSTSPWNATEPGLVEIGPLVAGTYRAAVFSSAGFAQMLGGPQCVQDCYDERFLGTLIEVPTTTDRIEVNLQLKPSLTVQVVRQDTGAPIANAQVQLIVNEYETRSGQTDLAGHARIASIETGTYVVHVAAEGFIDELFDNIACEDEHPLVNCPPAVPMVFSNASPSEQSIAVALSPSATMTGRIASREPTAQGYDGTATLYRLGADGAPLSTHFVYPDSGEYSLFDVPAGSHRWGIRTYEYHAQIFDGIDCYSDTSYLQFQNCPYASGTVVTNVNGGVRSGVDFLLMPRYSRVVRVLDAISDAPLQGIVIDQWSLNKAWQISYRTGADGRAYIRIHGNAVNSIYASYLSTDNLSEYLNEVYDNIMCAGGASAYLGNCSMQQAALVPISDTANSAFAPLEIKLLRDLVFRGEFDE